MKVGLILPTRPRTPRSRGKIERQIGHVQDNALKGRSFPSLAEKNAHLFGAEAHVAETRSRGTTQQQIREVSGEVEWPALALRPIDRSPFFRESRRVISSDTYTNGM